MIRPVCLCLLAAALLAVAAPACAQAAAKDAAAPSPVDAAFAKWDVNHDRALSLQEFRTGWAAQAGAARKTAQEAVQARLHGQFEAVDGNDDGGIDASEYPKLLLVRRAGKQAPALAGFDGNRDGRLQFDEYLQLVRRMAVPARTGGKP